MDLPRVNWKRAIPSGSFALFLLLSFWLSSRYPALNEKAGMGMGGRADMSALGFAHTILSSPDDGLPWRVFATFVNWSVTNKQGMTFGVLFAAAVLTLLATFTQTRTRNRVINTLKGMVMGAPLGVCANCAAPIGQGMHAAGERAETVLATVLSSPTLNVIVLAMVFGLFPLHFAAAKVALTVVVILVAIPLITTLFAGSLGEPGELEQGVNMLNLGRTETWGHALKSVVVDYGKNLWYIFKTTVPLMVLAGLLGAVTVELLPMDALSDLGTGLFTVGAVSLIGTFMPVPITFDVLIAFTLMQAGLSPTLAMVLLFTLGIYSVYPMAILWRAVGPSVAVAIYAVVTMVGMGGGYAVGAYDARNQEHVLQVAAEGLPAIAAPPGRSPAEWYALMEEGCAPVLAEPMRLECIESGLIWIAGQERQIEICGALPDTLADFRCRFAYMMSPAGDATRTRDTAMELCRELSDDPTSSNYPCVARGASIATDPQLCEAFEMPIRREHCHIGVQFHVAVETRDPGACDSLPEQKITQCRRKVYTELASDSANTRICDNITTGPKDQGLCRVRTLIEMNRKTGEGAHCRKIEEMGAASGIVDDCDKFTQLYAAIKSGDPAQCPLGEDKALTGYCWIQLMQDIERVVDVLVAKQEHASVTSLPEVEAPAVERRGPKAPPAPLDPVASDVVHEGDGVRVLRVAHRDRKGGQAPFTRLRGDELGLEGHRFTALEFHEPFVYGRGIAAGDVDGDGRPDVAFGTAHGVRLYLNQDGLRFAEVPLPALADLDVFGTALVDVDGDGLLDVYAAGYGGQNRVLINDGALFARGPAVWSLPVSHRLLSMASAFGDVDRDGDLDLFLGNWSFGSVDRFNPVRSQNELFVNNGSAFVRLPIPDVPGETLTALFSDLDGDRWPDLLVGNDGPGPDQIYRGGRDGLKPVLYGSSPLPSTSKFTMSYDSGDINNDLVLDVFSTDMSFTTSEGDDLCGWIDDDAQRRRCAELLIVKGVVKDTRVDHCEQVPDPTDRSLCLAAVVLQVALKRLDPAVCQRIPTEHASARALCLGRTSEEAKEDRRHRASPDHLPQVHLNALSVSQGDGTYKNLAKDMGVGQSFWSWNARFADVDADGWLDVFVANGYLLDGPTPGSMHPNVLYLNNLGRSFQRREHELGLGDLSHTSTSAFVDLDLDGDLDLIGLGPLQPVRVWVNHDVDHQAVGFRLRDGVGNSHGIGSRVVIAHGDRKQVRELKASGGFMSYDEPLAHFGLGEDTAVDEVVVEWSTGDRTTLPGPFEAGATYIIERPAREEG